MGIADKTVLQIGVDFFVRTRRQTGRIAGLCGGFADTVRAKKMRQDGVAEFISASLTLIIFRLSVNFLHIFYGEDYGISASLIFPAA